MKLAIVGSRDYPSGPTVRAFVRSLPLRVVIVSGGAKGVDSWAEDEAKRRGMRVAVYRPQRHVIEAHGFTEAAYARNRQIVEACDQLVAFSFSHSGGTAYTVRYAHSMGRPVTVYDWPDLPDLSR